MRYPGAHRPALSDVTFALRPGERVLLLGPSGAGKSTLALTCAGLIPRTVPAQVQGTIELDQIDLLQMRPQEAASRIAMVLQDPDVQVVRETLFDEVCFALENLRLPAVEIEDRARLALARLGLLDRAGDDPDRLSGGERQRLAIACALAQRPQLIVLDEPGAQLDPPGRSEVYRAVRDLAVATGCGLLLVGHDLGPVLSLVDRVLVLDRTGALALDGSPDLVTGSRRAQLFSLGVMVPPRSAHTPVRPQDANPLVEMRGVTVERPLRRGVRAAVLRDIDLTLAPGSVTAILGANGSGKTSLLRTLAGTLPVPHGTVRVGGQDPRRLEPAQLRRLVGFAFQNPSHQFVRDVVDDDLAQALGASGPTDPRVTRVLDDFGLSERRGANPLTLSFGQQRRLSVAAAMGPQPALLLLDEPWAGLDQGAADALLDRLRAYAAEGHTVVIATHDLDAAARWATSAVVLAGGRVLDSGPAVRLLADHLLLQQAGLEPGGDAATSPAPPAAQPPDGLLAGINPLAKLAVALPVMLALFFTANPRVFAAVGLVGLVGALAWSRRARHDLLRALPVAVFLGAVMTAALAVWVRPDLAAGTPALLAIGSWHLHLGAFGVSAIIVGRIAALLAVGTTFALTTEAPALTRALMRQAHLPYRVGYTVLATYRFVPRLLLELDTIRAARRLRGVAPGRGPVAGLRRWSGYPFPLLVASIRHAEQVAVSMDARAFGAFSGRTERTVSWWQRRDTAYVVGGLVVAAVVWAAAIPIW